MRYSFKDASESNCSNNGNRSLVQQPQESKACIIKAFVSFVFIGQMMVNRLFMTQILDNLNLKTWNVSASTELNIQKVKLVGSSSKPHEKLHGQSFFLSITCQYLTLKKTNQRPDSGFVTCVTCVPRLSFGPTKRVKKGHPLSDGSFCVHVIFVGQRHGRTKDIPSLRISRDLKFLGVWSPVILRDMEFLRNISTQLPHLWYIIPISKGWTFGLIFVLNNFLVFVAPRALVLKPNKQIIEPENASGKKHIDSNQQIVGFRR